MAPLTSFLQLVLLLLPLVLVAEAELENCPTRESLRQEVCSFDKWSETATAFRNETRFKHNGTDKSDCKSFSVVSLVIFILYSAEDNTHAPARLFDSSLLWTAGCRSSCPGVERENVTWCVRFAYVSSTWRLVFRLGKTVNLYSRVHVTPQLLTLRTISVCQL